MCEDCSVVNFGFVFFIRVLFSGLEFFLSQSHQVKVSINYSYPHLI